MTPVEIEVLMHCYYRCEPLEVTAAITKSLLALVDCGIIEVSPLSPGYRCTVRGEKYVKMLLGTPFPVQDSTWKDPRV